MRTGRDDLRHRRRGARRGRVAWRGGEGTSLAPAAWATALLTVRNVAERWTPQWTYVPVSVTLSAALIGLGRATGSSWDDLGLGRAHLGRGLRLGAVVGVAAAAVIGLGAAIPFTRPFFDDERVAAGGDVATLLHEALLAIPIGTVVFEEVAFRGVLLALLARRLSMRGAVVVSSVLFGLWHIRPTLGAAEANDLGGLATTGVVLLAVVATTVAGGIFCALRLHSGHVVAPVLVHLAINDTSYVLAWLLRS
jgi:uncharacterized protein